MRDKGTRDMMCPVVREGEDWKEGLMLPVLGRDPANRRGGMW